MKLLAIVGYLLIAAAPLTSNAANIFYFTSSNSAWVGAGQTRTITPAQGFTFSGRRHFNQGAYTNDIDLSMSSNSEYWYLDFLGPGNSLATVGSYPSAERYPFEGPGHPGLSFVGNGRGDNTLSGSFQVLQSEFDDGGELVAYAADFVQYDERNTARWNVGSIRFNSDVPVTSVPEPTTATLLLLGMLGCGWRRWRFHDDP